MADKKIQTSEESLSALPKSDDAVGRIDQARSERDQALADRDAAREALQKANQHIEALERQNVELRAMVQKLEAGAPAELPDGTAYIVDSVTFPRADTGASVDGKSGDIVVQAPKGSKAEAAALQDKFGAKHRVFPVLAETLDELLSKHLARRGR